MFKNLMIALMMVCALAAGAATAADKSMIDSAAWEKLSPAQRADIAKQVAVTAEQSNSNIPSAEKMDQYVDLGVRIGQMLGGVAKELGVAVNTFSETTVGKWTMAIAVWKLLGRDIMHLALGILVLASGFTVISFLARNRRKLEIEYLPERTFGIFKHVKSIRRGVLEESDVFVIYIASAATIAITSMIILN